MEKNGERKSTITKWFVRNCFLILDSIPSAWIKSIRISPVFRISVEASIANKDGSLFDWVNDFTKGRQESEPYVWFDCVIIQDLLSGRNSGENRDYRA